MRLPQAWFNGTEDGVFLRTQFDTERSRIRILSRLKGGSTPKASQVNRITLRGCPDMQGTLALGMNSIGL